MTIETPSSTRLSEMLVRQRTTYWRACLRQLAARLEKAARTFYTLENDLARFSEDYFVQVGPVASRLVTLEAQATQAPPFPFAAAEAEATPHIPPSHRDVLKSRYRALARALHPDTGNTATTADSMQQLNRAYAEGDMAAMLVCESQHRISQLAFHDEAACTQVATALTQQCEHYERATTRLRATPLYALMERAERARTYGWDWIDHVVTHMEATTERLRTTLAHEHIDAIRAWRPQPHAA